MFFSTEKLLHGVPNLEITCWGNLSLFSLSFISLGSFVKPNKSVKGTRRPLAVLKFGFYQGSAASFRFR
ncbi:hypothetical protein VZ94_20090 [Methylocucumis oryzae]|uniref:Uncharacterized protein n=1 Tax=Methylocucumis oryzae TaxID=1632867 RepID=A0A0F3IF67_9GAMM|nr:hypothetical protein VZ94_20090 [Methylocucumis oryzae]